LSVKIRLHRAGAKHRPFYRVVVTDSRFQRDGRFIEMLGYYDPMPSATMVKLDMPRVEHWLGRGAIASDTVRSLIKKAATMPTADQVAETARTRRATAVAEAGRMAPTRPAPEAGTKADGKIESRRPEARPPRRSTKPPDGETPTQKGEPSA
jgi:small subunit ribosomal protein S16